MPDMNELLNRMKETKEGETICLNHEECHELLKLIEDQEERIATTEEAYEKGFTAGQNNMLEAQAEGL